MGLGFEFGARLRAAAVAAVCVWGGAAGAQEARVRDVFTPSDDTLSDYCRWVGTEDGPRWSASIGLASGAHRRAGDPRDALWAVSDLGPKFACEKRSALEISAPALELCEDARMRRFEPSVDCAPTLYQLDIDRGDDEFEIIDEIKLKSASGVLVSGLRSSAVRPALGQAVDAEAVARLSDGGFWIGEEVGPSLLRVAADGRVLERLVPMGDEVYYAGADTVISPTLPRILAGRATNAGIEALAVSPDESRLYFTTQRPLGGGALSRVLRIFELARAEGVVTAEYVYLLDDDAAEARVSEMTMLGPDRLLVLERGEGVRLYEVALDPDRDIWGGRWDDAATLPALEDRSKLAGTGLRAVEKTLLAELDIDDKVEGMAFLGDGDLVLLTDNDFGADGEPSRILRLRDEIEPDPSVHRAE